MAKTSNHGILALYLGRVTDDSPSTYRLYNLSTGYILFKRNAKFMKLMYLDHFQNDLPTTNRYHALPVDDDIDDNDFLYNPVAENRSGELEVDTADPKNIPNAVDTNNITDNEDDLPDLVIDQDNEDDLPELVIDQNLVNNNIPETINEWDDIDDDNGNDNDDESIIKELTTYQYQAPATTSTRYNTRQSKSNTPPTTEPANPKQILEWKKLSAYYNPTIKQLINPEASPQDTTILEATSTSLEN
jgi:hypothetical protein